MDGLKRVRRRLRELELLRRSGEVLGHQLAVAPPEQRRQLQRLLHRTQAKVRMVELALEILLPQERVVVELMDIRPAKGNAERLCEILQVEPATVYRRREQAERKLGRVLFGE